MLDAISDFWKPMKKNQSQEKLKPEQLQVGSTVGFGFVPQVNLSGRRLTVSAINAYQFGEESLTSFVLSQDKEAGVSMIVAESEGEQYLAISRRIAMSDRIKLCDSKDLENVMEKPEIATLACKDNLQDFKGWLVSSYKREIQGLPGRIFKGDFRKTPLPDAAKAEEFTYTLLVSDNNEQALEVEKYADGRIEMYATVYRRISDIGEVTHPARAELSRPDLKLASQRPEDKSKAAEPAPVIANAPKMAVEPAKPEAAKPAVLPEEVKAEPIQLHEFPAATPLAPAEPKPEPKTESQNITKESKPMPISETATNGAGTNPKLASMAAGYDASAKPEVKAMSKAMNGMENEAIECDLKVANKIIDEAIRNEMRLSDVVRRVIELPVAHQEAVHIPVTLSDEDFALLAIRYSMNASDRNAIKKRIIEDLNNFSGNKKAA
jgi:hypothetical protein